MPGEANSRRRTEAACRAVGQDSFRKEASANSRSATPRPAFRRSISGNMSKLICAKIVAAMILPSPRGRPWPGTGRIPREGHGLRPPAASQRSPIVVLASGRDAIGLQMLRGRTASHLPFVSVAPSSLDAPRCDAVVPQLRGGRARHRRLGKYQFFRPLRDGRRSLVPWQGSQHPASQSTASS